MPNHPWIENAVPFPAGDPALAHRLVSSRIADLIAAVREADPSWNPPPYDPERCARAIGVPVKRTTTERVDWDALLFDFVGRPVIGVNGRVRSRARVGFSVAHELAHLVFEREGEYQFRTTRREVYETEEARELERACDRGAAELLMPSADLEKLRERHGFHPEAIFTLADAYRASFEAAALRLLESEDGPAAAGLFDFAARPSDAKDDPRRQVTYRVRRVFQGPGFPYLFPPGKSVPETSAVYRASLVKGEVVAQEEYTLGPRRVILSVTAKALPSDRLQEGPPVVCAVFRTYPTQVNNLH